MASLLKNIKKFTAADKIILLEGIEQYSFDKLTKSVNHFSRILKKLEIYSLAIYADNSVDWLIADLACQKLDICLLPLPDYFSNEQLQHALSTCAVQFILTDRPDQLISNLPSMSLEKKFDYSTGLCFLARTDSTVAANLPESTQKITFTSGSTGQPKGVCLSLQQQIQQAQVLAELIDLHEPVHLCLLPLSTLLENIAGIYAPLLAGGTVNICSLEKLGYDGSRLIDPKKMLDTIVTIKPDTLILIPQLLMLLVQAAAQGWPVPAFKFVAVGGSKVAPELLQQARKLGIPAYEGYGLSECASVVSLNVPKQDQTGSCGKALPHLQLSVKNNELVITGNSMLGYVNDPDSWYPSQISSGDLGYIDNEGFVHINGRSKNVLISSYGRNISPEWVESELLVSPLLAEAVVFGDAQPFCTALVYPRMNSTSDLQIERAIDHANTKLPDYARIRAWRRLESPLSAHTNFMTSNGRPRRDAIADFYEAEIALLYPTNNTTQIYQAKESNAV